VRCCSSVPTQLHYLIQKILQGMQVHPTRTCGAQTWMFWLVGSVHPLRVWCKLHNMKRRHHGCNGHFHLLGLQCHFVPPCGRLILRYSTVSRSMCWTLWSKRSRRIFHLASSGPRIFLMGPILLLVPWEKAHHYCEPNCIFLSWKTGPVTFHELSTSYRPERAGAKKKKNGRSLGF